MVVAFIFIVIIVVISAMIVMIANIKVAEVPMSAVSSIQHDALIRGCEWFVAEMCDNVCFPGVVVPEADDRKADQGTGRRHQLEPRSLGDQVLRNGERQTRGRLAHP